MTWIYRNDILHLATNSTFNRTEAIQVKLYIKLGCHMTLYESDELVIDKP